MGKKQILEAIVGLVGGDEGKGKIVDERANAAIELGNGRVVVVRFQGGCNAGHSVYVRNKAGVLVPFVTHGAPSGLTNKADIAVGPQVALNPIKLHEEIAAAISTFQYDGRVMISERTGVLFDYHIKLDEWKEKQGGTFSVGSTGSGIGPFYQDNAGRTTRITFGDYVSDRFPDMLADVVAQKRSQLQEAGIWHAGYVDELLAQHEHVRKELAPFAERLEYRMQEYLKRGHIIIEGAQGTILDVDMGTIPDQTSSHLLAPHAFPSLGLPRAEFTIYGVEKVYPTRVGKGDLVTLASNDFGEKTATNAGEYGATTGRRRRVGYPDWVYSRYAAMVNDVDGIYIMRADNVQDEELRACIAYHHPAGTVNAEVPLSLRDVRPVYGDRTYSWHLWDGPADLSKPELVDEALRPLRAHYVDKGLEGLPQGLVEFRRDHDAFVGRPTVGISIGPARGETILFGPKR